MFVRMALIAALFWGGAAAADEASQALEEARALIAQGKPAEAARALETALASLDRRAPLEARAAEFVDEVEGYGQYVPHGSNVYHPNDEIKLYIEPTGFHHVKDGDFYEVSLKADFELRLESGKPILGHEILQIPFRSRRQIREFHITISFDFEGLKPGEYKLVTRLQDLASGKWLAIEKTLLIVPPADAPTAARSAE